MAQNAPVPLEPIEHPGHPKAPARARTQSAGAQAVASRPSSRSSRPGPTRWSPQPEARVSFKNSLLQNPILEREMRSRWRRPLTYIVLLAYAGILSWVAWQLSGTALEQSRQLSEGFGAEGTATLPGTALFRNSVCAQVLVALWASAMLCAPVIARERELKMLPELILANLSPGQIVRGKWLATLGFAAVLLLIPLPLQALAFLMGGVSPGEWIGAAILQAGAMILGSAMGLWCSALSDRVAGAMSRTCVGAALLSAPLLIGLAAITTPQLHLGPWILPSGPWLSVSMALACVLVALPLLAGAQNSVKYLPLDALRPAAVDLPSSHAQAASQPTAASARASEPAPESVLSGEQPSAPIAPVDDFGLSQDALLQARLEKARAQRALELEQRAYGARRESWVFPLLRTAGWHNPLVWRELRVRLRQPFFDVSTLLSIALCLLALPALGAMLMSPRGDAIGVVLPFWILCGVACALGAAQGFTREREQRMLEGLLLSTLSPRTIVVGKVAAPILLALHTGALPLALFVGWTVLWSLMHGALVAPIAIAGCVIFSLLGAACGTWLSFWCRTSAVSAMGSLAMFWGLLCAPFTLSHIGPNWFQTASQAFWEACLLKPLGDFDGSEMFWRAGIFGGSLLLATSLALLSHIVLVLRPKALEREGHSFLHTDLTRNLH